MISILDPPFSGAALPDRNDGVVCGDARSDLDNALGFERAQDAVVRLGLYEAKPGSAATPGSWVGKAICSSMPAQTPGMPERLSRRRSEHSSAWRDHDFKSRRT